MRQRIQSFGWHNTPLGPISGWPAHLCAAVEMLLGNPFPQVLLWGPQWIVCAYNDAYVPILGHKPEPLGCRFLDVWEEVREILEPSLTQASNGEPSFFTNADFTLLREGFPETVWFDYAFSPVRDPSGAVFAVLNTGQDKTAQVLTQRQLAESEERFRAFVNTSSEVVYRLSPDWSEMHELDGRGVVADTLASSKAWMDKYVHEDDQPKVRAEIEAAVREKRAFELEHRFPRVDGTTGWTLSRAIPRFDQSGNLVEWFGAASDVTRRKEAEEALRSANEQLTEADRRKDEFLATLAHELRNPLAPIQSGLDVLRITAGNLEEAQRVLPIMQRQMAQIKRLVDDLLDISRITRGKITLAKRPVDLCEAVRDVVGATSLNALRNIDLELPEEPLMIHGDETRLKQIIGNIVDNAVDYTEEETGSIRISVNREDQNAVIRIQDDGIGIPPELLDRIFSPYEQGESAKGLGLGLALVRLLAEMHGGRVEAGSAGVGEGSEFLVYLPLMDMRESA